MKTLELKQKRAALVAQARQILDAAEVEKRGLSAEESTQYDRIMQDVDGIGATIEKEERIAAIEGELRKSDREPIRQSLVEPTRQEQRASKEYREAFLKQLRYSKNALFADEIRALQVGTDSEGGFLVPDEFERTMIEALETQNIMRRLASVMSTASGDKIIPVVASKGTASWTAEEAGYTESDNAFSQITLGAHKVATLIKVSEELLNDSAFNLAAYISNEFARRIGKAEETAFVNGDGSGKPTGVVQGATLGKTGANGQTTSVTADDLIDLYHSLGRPYRGQATWLFSDTTARAIRKLKDGDGQYLWQPGITADRPDSLFGRPVAISDDVPNMAASARSILFGDFSYYWIADRQGRVLQRLNELYAVNGQIGFRAYQRVDGKLTLGAAVKYYANSAL